MRTFQTILLILATQFAQLSLAASPSSFSYEGVLTDSSGNPVNLSGRTISFSVVNSADCVIFSETSSSAGNSEGQISHAVGTGTNVYGAINSDLFNKSKTGQSACSVTASEARFLKIEVSSLAVSATVSLSSVPYALEANQVGGFAASHLLRVADGGVPQSIAALTSAQATELMNIINGSTALYINSASPSFSSAPTYSGAPSSGNQLTNKTYVDAAISSALTGYTLPNSVVGATYPKITFNNQGLVTAGSALAETDIPTLSTAGKVSGNAINSGTIGGSTAINTTGAIETTTSVTAGTLSGSLVKANNLRLYNGATNYIQIQAPTLGAIVSFTLPNGVGANGQFLKTDGAGNLTWDTPTGSGDASYAAKGLVQFSTDAATSGINVASGVAFVNTGTGANQIVKLDGSGKLPAVDGSNLTNLDVGDISAGVLPIARGGTSNGSLGVTAGGVVYGDGSKLMMSAAGSSGQALISAGAGAPAFGTLGVGGGGTGITTGISGGIPYFSASNTMASSAALTANGVVLGGGAGFAPTATAAGAAYSVLRVPSGGGTPGFGAIDLSQSAAVTGTLAIGNGGTGVTSLTPDRLLGTNVSGALSFVNCSQGQVLSFNASGVYGCYNVGSIFSGFKDGGNTFTATATLGTDSNHNLDIETNGNVRMTIKNDGKVGIGTTNPNSALQVSGGIQLSDDPDTCMASKSGTFRYTLSNQMEYCNGTAWTLLATGAAAPNASYATKGQVQFDTDAATSGISVTSGVAKLSSTGVTANTYGSATKVGAFTVDPQGRITSASDTSIALPASQITQSGANTGEVLKWNGINWAPAVDSGATTDASYAAKGIVQFNTDSATSGITVVGGVASVNTGTGANQIVKLGPDSKLPSIDGGALTNLSAGNISSGTLPIARGGTNSGAALTNNKVMVSSGGAIVEGVGFGSTNTASTFVTRDLSGNFEANGLTLNSMKLKGATSGTLTITVPATVSDYTIRWPATVGGAGAFLTTDATGNLSWGSPAAISDASYSVKGAVQFNTDVATSGINVASGIASVNTGTGANQIVKLDGSGKLPPVDGSALTGLLSSQIPSLDAAKITTGVLPIARGGTNNGSLGVTAGGVIYGDGSKLMMSAAGTSGQALISTGAGVPAFGTLGAAGGGTGSSSYANGDMIYATGSTALSKLGIGGSGTILKSTGLAPAWSTLTAAGIFENGGNSFGGSASIGTKDPNELSFKTNDTPRMRISSTGQVGIGMTPGADQLSVKGDTRLDGELVVNTNTSVGNSKIIIQETTAGAAEEGPPELTLAASRNWDSSPMANGEVIGNLFFKTTFGGWNTSASISAVASELHSNTARGTELRFSTTNNATNTVTDKMVIKHDGKVGIGTSSPDSKLNINGDLTLLSTSSPASPGSGKARFYLDSGTGKIRVSQNGGAYVDLFSTDGSALTNLNAGNISSGVLPIARGGTNNGSLGVTAGGVVYGDGSRLMMSAAGSSGQALISAGAGAPAFGTLGVGGGGTGITTGISGGIPYFSATNTMASSAALNANGVVLGGGAGVAPTATAAGAAYSVLRVPFGGGTPGFGAIDLSQSAAVTGTLAIGNGGTGVTSLTPDRLLGTTVGGALSFVNCSQYQVLSFNASGIYGCYDVSSIYNGFVDGGNSFAATANLGTNSYHDLNFKTFNTTRVIVTKDGNVGIGSLAPDRPLSIAKVGNSQFSNTSYSTSTGTSVGSFIELRRSNSATLGDPVETINDQVFGMIDFQGVVEDGSTSWKTGARITGRQKGTIGAFSAGPPTSLIFSTANNGTLLDRMKIEPDGKVIIGSPISSFGILNIKGDLYVEGSTTNCTLGNGAGGTNCSSDQRLKEEIHEIPDALRKISSLRGVEFKWNEKTAHPGTDAIGVIAQEVEKVFPTAVVNNPETGYKMVDYAVLVAPLIQALKELYKTYLDQEEQINRLKDQNRHLIESDLDKQKKISDLESRLQKLEQHFQPTRK